MKKFKFIVLALVGVGALSCSGHKITMKPIDLAAAKQVYGKIQNKYRSSAKDLEVPDNFAYYSSSTVDLTQKIKDSRGSVVVTMTELDSEKVKYYFDINNLRYKLEMTEVKDRTKVTDDGRNFNDHTESNQEEYVFYKDGKVTKVDNVDGTYVLMDEYEMAEDVWKNNLKTFAINNIFVESFNHVNNVVPTLLQSEEAGLEKPDFIENKHGSNDDQSYQLISKYKRAYHDTVERIKIETVGFVSIEKYIATDIDLATDTITTLYDVVMSEDIDTKIKIFAKMEENKGNFSVPENYIKP